MATQYIVRRSTILPGAPAKANAAPIYVDSDDNKLKMIPAGTGTTEVEIVDASTAQTLTNKTLTSPVITATDATLTTPTIDGVHFNAYTDRQFLCKATTLAGATIQAAVTPVFVAPADCIIHKVILDVTTKSTLASTVDVGTTSASATTTSDNLLDGIDTGTAAIFVDSVDPALDSAANVKSQKLANGKWITITSKTGDTSALVGKIYVIYTLI